LATALPAAGVEILEHRLIGLIPVEHAIASCASLNGQLPVESSRQSAEFDHH
jgi:hypothetical protein